MNHSRPLAGAASDALAETCKPLDLDTLFRTYAPYVAAVAHKLLGRDDEVDDVIQEVFIAALRGLHRVRDPGAIKGWLACVTVRTARRKLRMRRVRQFISTDPAPNYTAVADASASPEQRALMSRVYQLLDTLPVDQRVPWVLRHIEGEGLERVAVLCGCSLATAKRRISRASGALQDALTEGEA